MTLTSPISGPDRRLAALALTLGMHIAVLLAWHLGGRVSEDGPGDAANGIQWLIVPKAEQVSTPKPQLAKPAAVPARPQASAIPVSPSDASSSLSEEVAVQAESAPASELSTLERARRAVGEIDRGLQEANKSKFIHAKPVSTQMRLERAMQKAHDMVPNKWYEAAKVTEIIDPGGYGRRRYRVVGANGTYCITIESNHAPDGIDTMQHGIKPKLTNCDADEQAATKQDW